MISHQPPLIQIWDSPLWWQLTLCLLAGVTWNSLKECHAAWSDEEQLHGREPLPLRWELTCHTLQAYKWTSGHVPNISEWSLFFAPFSSWHLVRQDLTGGGREESVGQDGELIMRWIRAEEKIFGVGARIDVWLRSSEFLSLPHDVMLIEQ